jgi:PAS domain S-box-containing protein
VTLTVILELYKGDYPQAIMPIVISVYYYLLKSFKTKWHEQLKVRERHFKSLVNHSLHPLILSTQEGVVTFISSSLKEIIHLGKNLKKGHNLKDLLHPQDISIYDKLLEDITQKPFMRQTAEVRIKTESPDWIWIKLDSVNLLNHPHIRAISTSIQDITSQKNHDHQKTEILKQESLARLAAETAVRERDEFLSIASHELKTPLTTVLLQLQTTLKRIVNQSLADFSGADLLRSIQIAEKQSQRLSTLIKDLLNVSIASTGRITLNKELTNLSILVESLLDRYEEEIKMSGVNINTHYEEDIVGQWDQIRIEQCVSNLVMNALKYAPQKTVNISVKRINDWAVVEVADEGKGIPQALLTTIFEPFKRVDSDKAIDGLGVGLFIAKQIALSHGGTIKVESAPDVGTTFTLWIPLTA